MGRGNWITVAALALTMCTAAWADIDAAQVFGTRPSVAALALSPDGHRLAYVSPDPGRGGVLFVADPDVPAKSLPILRILSPEAIDRCDWVDLARILCRITGLRSHLDGQTEPYHRLVAVDADGTNLQLLGGGELSLFSHVGEPNLIDLHGGAPGVVLVERASKKYNTIDVGVERLDTRTGESVGVEPPSPDAGGYMSDGNGRVVLKATRRQTRLGYDRPYVPFFVRRTSNAKWEPLCEWDVVTHDGFLPVVVDGGANRVYGLQKLNGRLAVYARPIGGGPPELVRADENVDVEDIITLDSANTVIGVSISRDYRDTEYLDPTLGEVAASIRRALPGYRGVQLTDASGDGKRLLVFAHSDADPGVYFMYDRESHRLQTLYVVRSALEGVTLGVVKPVRYPAADGTSIPAYLTLPPGVTDPKGLPALVMPHGGPAARDEWGFDWLAQFYAHQGYAVLQPNFRGSAGYGDAWYEKNGIRSWRIAIGDVIDGGRWLVSSGVADPARLAIVGWSYGGYAALQAAVTAPDLFRAVVAVAPLTDLPKFKESFRYHSDFYIIRDYMGSGSELSDGSPARHATLLRAPVLLVHGRSDGNVPFSQTEIMDKALSAAKAPHEVLAFDGLSHQLNDSDARMKLLRRSDAFIKQAFAAHDGK